MGEEHIVSVRVTQYWVSLLPENHPSFSTFLLRVEYCGHRRWAVRNTAFCLGADGQWRPDRPPYEDEQQWLAAHRFDMRTALRMARQAAPHVEANGRAAAERLARDDAD